jgi:regulator of protease activity HflC (stomatin/prohibitin superfamily)
MNSNGQAELGIFFIILLAVVFAALTCIAIVPAGNIGIQDSLGSVGDYPLNPGFQFKAPWTGIVPMSVQTIELKEEASTPSSEGLMVGLHMSVLYKVEPTKAVQIYKTIGRDFQNVVIAPTLRSAIREVTAKYEAKALYSGQRDALANEIHAQIEPVLSARGIIIEKVLLRELIIPDQVKNAIEQKLRAEQESQAMEFVLTKEAKEAERKVIEATGIRDSQDIINDTLTTEYLQYLWISQLNVNPNIIYVQLDSQGPTLFRDVDKTPVVKPTLGDGNK